MTKNNIKVILFASLIVAMVLPYSVMNMADAVSNENADEKAKKITGKTHIKDTLERAPDTLTEEKRMLIRGHIDTLSAIMSETLADGTIPMVGVGTDFKEESLKVKLLREGLTEEKIKLYVERIREIVGNDIDITILPSEIGTFTACSQSGDCEPLQGGTKITVESGLSCSMGFKASYDGKTGFITAGHCNSGNIGGTGEDVGNPSASAGDKLGVVHANDFENNSWCDCIFVDATESISDKVYSGIDVSGTLFPVVDDLLKWEGYGSSGGSTDIVDTYESFTALLEGNYYTIQGAVEVEDTFSSGDSGGTVYEDVSSGTPRFAGTAMGNQDGNGFYVPYYRYTNAFSGLTFTYT